MNRDDVTHVRPEDADGDVYKLNWLGKLWYYSPVAFYTTIGLLLAIGVLVGLMVVDYIA